MITRKHTFLAENFTVVRLEEIDAISNLRDDLIATYQPVNSQELWAVERIALAQQALNRCTRTEAGMYTARLNEALAPDGRPLRLLNLEMVEDIDVTRAQNRNFIPYEGLSQIGRAHV